MKKALAQADFVQESAPERSDLKIRLFADMDKAAPVLIDEFGYDTVDAGPLKEGWRIQSGTPGYGPRRTAEQLREDLASAKRRRDQATATAAR
jgi:predicted dinucleotide-binding enzyme